MPQSCCVLKCTHYRHKNWHCRLFRFPADRIRAFEWEQNIGRNWKRKPWDRICECHFEEQEFEQHREDGKKKLLPTALPSVFPTHCVKLATRPSHDHSQPSGDQLDDDGVDGGCGGEPLAWQLLQVESECSSDTEIPVDYLKEVPENCIPEASDQQVHNGNVSPNSVNGDGSSTAGESTALVKGYQQQIMLLKQTLHNYKQRAWHMDIVLAALRRENELLRGAVQELSPGHLNNLLGQQSS